MGEKKFKDNYPTDKKNTVRSESKQQNTLQDKRSIEAYLKKISELLQNDPNMQKKAALILENMINQKKKK